MLQQKIKKPKINEAVIVEGRDDAAAVSEAIDALIIATHGFYIKEETWRLIDKADREKGIIILTDPDHAGETIRRKIAGRYPDALQANIPRNKAKKNGDIGVENAKPEDIVYAITNAKGVRGKGSVGTRTVKSPSESDAICIKDTYDMGIFGGAGARAKRERLCSRLGIGYCNAKVFVKRANLFGITKSEILEALTVE